MATITLDEAKERIRRLAEERPDYVYTPARETDHNGIESTACVYFDPEGKPGCIVGHAFADELRAAGVDFYTRASVTGLTVRGVLTLDPGAQDFLGHVQGKQDNGTPWGDAYREALRAIGE